MLVDKHGRSVTYLRLAVTNRCNLRCFYCMPEEGIQYVPKSELLSYEEMYKLVSLFYRLGVRKLRIIGGEPFLRKDLLSFLKSLTTFSDLKIHITSNGTILSKYLKQLKQMGIYHINLSLDTLNEDNSYKITRRKTYLLYLQ